MPDRMLSGHLFFRKAICFMRSVPRPASPPQFVHAVALHGWKFQSIARTILI